MADHRWRSFNPRSDNGLIGVCYCGSVWDVYVDGDGDAAWLYCDVHHDG